MKNRRFISIISNSHSTITHRSGLLVSNCNPHGLEDKPSPLISMLWTIRIGAKYEEKSTRGMSHYVMHSLFAVFFEKSTKF